MRVQGKVDLEGITLLVDIEAPDDEKELWVTNVHPNCLVIPRERWRVEYLGLSEAVLGELREKGIQTLADILEPGTWTVRAERLSSAARDGVLKALQNFQEMALLSGPPSLPAETAKAMPVPLPEKPKPAAEPEAAGASGNGRKWYGPDVLLENLALAPRIIKILAEQRGVKTGADLLRLGRRLVMTKGLLAQDIREVQQVMGLIRSEAESPADKTVSAEESAAARAHLAEQGLREPR